MAILPILTAPHPILEAKAREVAADEFGEDLVKLLDDMAETMYDAPGVGLAAPQVGDGRRIVCIDSGEDGGSGLLASVTTKATGVSTAVSQAFCFYEASAGFQDGTHKGQNQPSGAYIFRPAQSGASAPCGGWPRRRGSP